MVFGDIDLKYSLMFGTSLFVATCIYYKRTKSKQSTRNCKHPKTSGPNNSNKTTVRSNTEMNEKEVIVPLYDIIDDDDDSCYYVPGKRYTSKKVFRMTDKTPKKEEEKSNNVENINIPKKVLIPMLKIPKSFENRRSPQAKNRTKSLSLLRRLLESSGERFHRTTRINESIVRKRFSNTLVLTSIKKMESSLIETTNVGNIYSSVLSVPPEIGSVELGKDEMEYIDVEGDHPDCCRNRYMMKRGFRYLFNQEKLNNR